MTKPAPSLYVFDAALVGSVHYMMTARSKLDFLGRHSDFAKEQFLMSFLYEYILPLHQRYLQKGRFLPFNYTIAALELYLHHIVGWPIVRADEHGTPLDCEENELPLSLSRMEDAVARKKWGRNVLDYYDTIVLGIDGVPSPLIRTALFNMLLWPSPSPIPRSQRNSSEIVVWGHGISIREASLKAAGLLETEISTAPMIGTLFDVNAVELTNPFDLETTNEPAEHLTFRGLENKRILRILCPDSYFELVRVHVSGASGYFKIAPQDIANKVKCRRVLRIL